MVSCLKDGLDDFEGLGHPISGQISINPNLGFPVAKGELSLAEILGLVKESNTIVELEDDVATLRFDTSFHFTIPFQGTGKGHKSESETFSESINGSLNIDIFKNLQNLPSPDDLRVENIFLNLGSWIKFATSNNQAMQAMIQRYNIHAYLDNITLRAFDKNGNSTPIQIGADQRIDIHNMFQRENVDLFNQYDVSQIINLRPIRLDYSFRVNIAVDEDIFEYDLISFLKDSVKMEAIELDPYISLRCPLAIYCSGLEFGTDLDIASGKDFDWGEFKIDSSCLYLHLKNSLPITFLVGAEFQDENSQPLFQLFNGNQISISGGILHPIGSQYCVEKASESIVKIPLTQNRLELLKQAKKLHIHSIIGTSTSGAVGDHPTVVVQGKDALGISLHVQIHPEATFTFPISEGKESKK